MYTTDSFIVRNEDSKERIGNVQRTTFKIVLDISYRNSSKLIAAPSSECTNKDIYVLFSSTVNLKLGNYS